MKTSEAVKYFIGWLIIAGSAFSSVSDEAGGWAFFAWVGVIALNYYWIRRLFKLNRGDEGSQFFERFISLIFVTKLRVGVVLIAAIIPLAFLAGDTPASPDIEGFFLLTMSLGLTHYVYWRMSKRWDSIMSTVRTHDQVTIV